MLKVQETTAADVYAHAMDHGDRPVIHGAEIDYDDIHSGVHYHADLLEAAKAKVTELLGVAEKARREADYAAVNLAIAVDLAEQDGRDPRKFATFDADLAAYRAASSTSREAHKVLEAAANHRDALRAKRDQDAALATYAVPA